MRSFRPFLAFTMLAMLASLAIGCRSADEPEATATAQAATEPAEQIAAAPDVGPVLAAPEAPAAAPATVPVLAPDAGAVLLEPVRIIGSGGASVMLPDGGGVLFDPVLTFGKAEGDTGAKLPDHLERDATGADQALARSTIDDPGMRLVLVADTRQARSVHESMRYVATGASLMALIESGDRLHQYLEANDVTRRSVADRRACTGPGPILA